MGQMANRVALVTGGASGIGRASALILARAGASVCVSDINDAGGEESAQIIVDEGGRAMYVHCDVTNASDVRAMAAATVEAYGQLDAAVNSAGIAGSFNHRLHEADDGLLDQVLAVNLKGIWLCMKAELEHMLPRGRGTIVNIASVAGLIGAPKAGAYTASKHGVVGLTRSAALEYAAHGIRVNAICPAYTDTAMVRAGIAVNPAMEAIMTRAIPMRRLGTAEEIAGAALWLCSEASSFMTGHPLVLDGGLSAS